MRSGWWGNSRPVRAYCRACDTVHHFPNNWAVHGAKCKDCGVEDQWRTINEPKQPYGLSHNDKRFLKALRITQD